MSWFGTGSAFGAYDLIAQAGSAGGMRPPGRRLRQGLLTQSVRDAIADASQHAVRNDIEARGAIRRMQQYVVGARGPTIKPTTGDAGADAALAEIYREWSAGTGEFRCDVMGLRSFAAMLRGVVEEWMASGRAALLKVDAADSDGSLQEIEARRLLNANSALDSNTRIAGLELARAGGRVKAYHVARVMQGGMWLSTGTEPVPAEDVIYAMQPLDAPPGVVAPEPVLGVGIRTINQIVEAMGAQSEAMRVQAMSPVAIKRGAELGDLGDGQDGTDPAAPGFTKDELGHRVYQLTRDLIGNIIDLAPGDDIVNLRQEIDGASIKPLIEVQMQRLGMLTGFGPHILTGDFAATSWSVAKLEIQATEAVRDTLYHELIRAVVTPAYRHMVDAALRLGLITPPARDDVDLYAFAHRPPPLPDPDPDKTQQTRGFQLSRGMITMGEYLEERGRTLEAHARELAAERTLLESLDLTHPMDRDDSGEDANLSESGEAPERGEPRPNESRQSEGAGGGRRGDNRRESFR